MHPCFDVQVQIDISETESFNTRKVLTKYLTAGSASGRMFDMKLDDLRAIAESKIGSPNLFTAMNSRFRL